jgi:hypothetical protein
MVLAEAPLVGAIIRPRGFAEWPSASPILSD